MLRALAMPALILLVVLFLWFNAQGAKAPRSPLETVKNTVESLRAAVKNPALKKEAKQSRIRELISEQMDFEEMGRRALGSHWRGRTDAEKEEYLGIFAKLMEVFYRKQVFESIEFIDSVDIKYKERLDGDFAEVDMQVVARNDKTSITFKLHLAGGEWKAYDVVVENISTVNNWRAQFDRIIEKEKFEGFLRRLREKIIELDK